MTAVEGNGLFVASAADGPRSEAFSLRRSPPLWEAAHDGQ